MKEKLAKLIELKSIITLMIILTLCYMTVTKQIEAKDFLMIATMIVTYYFTRKSNTN